MPRTPDPRTARPLLAVAAALLAGGVGLAIVQPGDLGDDDEGTSASATTTTESTTTTTSASVTVTTDASGTTATTDATGATATTAGTASTATTGTTAPGSGLGTSGTSRADDATAETGMESLLGPGLLLGAAAAGLRSTGRRRR